MCLYPTPAKPNRSTRSALPTMRARRDLMTTPWCSLLNARRHKLGARTTLLEQEGPGPRRGGRSGEQLRDDLPVANDRDGSARRGPVRLRGVDAQAAVEGRRHVVG